MSQVQSNIVDLRIRDDAEFLELFGNGIEQSEQGRQRFIDFLEAPKVLPLVVYRRRGARWFLMETTYIVVYKVFIKAGNVQSKYIVSYDRIGV